MRYVQKEDVTRMSSLYDCSCRVSKCRSIAVLFILKKNTQQFMKVSIIFFYINCITTFYKCTRQQGTHVFFVMLQLFVGKWYWCVNQIVHWLAQIIEIFMICSLKNKIIVKRYTFSKTLLQLLKTKTSTKTIQNTVRYACLCVRVKRLEKIFIIITSNFCFQMDKEGINTFLQIESVSKRRSTLQIQMYFFTMYYEK